MQLSDDVSGLILQFCVDADVTTALEYCYYHRDNPFTKTKQNVDMLMDTVQDFAFSPKLTVGISYNKHKYQVACCY